MRNWNSTEAFAKFTDQEFAVYYAEDTVGCVGHKTTLTGQNAINAWDTPIKSNANDLSGRLPLVVGSGGTFIGVKYEIQGGRRYAISVDVEILAYTSSDPNTEHPHRLTLAPAADNITYKRRFSEVVYSTQRHRVPIIGSFSCTAHNSQSRSLAGVVHLSSCTSTAAAYVMLSRIKCDDGEPRGLAFLGNIDPKRISTCAPEEVRAEEKRLRSLAKQTLRRAKDLLSWYTDLAGEQF